MKFGKLENIENVNFGLPKDHPRNLEIDEQSTGESRESILYTGATSWNNSAWKGVIFPEKVKKADFLHHYSRQFNSIELNATHYRTPEDKTIETWKEETPEDFRFCPKILQAISHRKDMVTNRELFNRFCIQLLKLEEKVGCCFLQLPPYFKIDNLPYLEKYLQLWPGELRIAVELRNTEMHSNYEYFNQYLDLLHEYSAIPLITDVSGRRDILHMARGKDIAFVRWVGNGLHESDFIRIKEWLLRLEEWTKSGLKEIYFHLHEPENETTPQIAEYFSDQLKNNEYISHRGPKLIESIPNLFS